MQATFDIIKFQHLEQFHPWNFPSKSTGVVCNFLFQGTTFCQTYSSDRTIILSVLQLYSSPKIWKIFSLIALNISPSPLPLLWRLCCSVTKSCPTLCNPVNCSTLGFPLSLSPRVFSNSCPLSQWCQPTISFSVAHFSSCPQSFPVSQLFASGGQITGASPSASVLSMNIQVWFPLGLTCLISLLSKGLSTVFSSTII